MSHGCAWRDSCASTRRDKRSRWLWRLVGPGFDCGHGSVVFFRNQRVIRQIRITGALISFRKNLRLKSLKLAGAQIRKIISKASKQFFSSRDFPSARASRKFPNEPNLKFTLATGKPIKPNIKFTAQKNVCEKTVRRRAQRQR
jgi:hypothetical protein